ncbi:MAG: carboxypeptidase regulatory-like domain-containing protein [Haloarculaceae archaeon]
MSMSGARSGTCLLSLIVVLATVAGVAVAPATATGSASESGVAASQDDVTLTVTVVDQSGNPLDDVKLSATWDGGGPVNATTAGNGKAFLDVPEGADVAIRTDRSFYVRNRPYVVENATEREVTIEMAQRGRATVVVRDENGRVENAIVRMFQDGRPVINERTGADGTFTTPDIERDEYTLITFKEGYLRNKTKVTVDGRVEQTMTIEQSTVLATFSVTDDHFDPPRPLTNANVSLRGIADVTTQSSGRVTISVPVNDRYEVEVTKPGYGTVTRELEVDESDASLNVSIQRTPAISIRTDNQRVVVGEPVRVTVTDEYGTPVPNATVSLNGTTVAETNSEGVASATVERAGNQTIRASADGLEASAVVEGVEPAPDETPTPTPTATPTTVADGAGMGLVAAVLALLVVAVLARQRR